MADKMCENNQVTIMGEIVSDCNLTEYLTKRTF